MTNGETSDKNNEHVLKIWKAFKMSALKCYYNLYLKDDILLLAFVFKAFRKRSINFFDLDIYQYLSTPA